MTEVAGYEHYDLQEEDHYLILGSTCLINSLGILDTQLLNEAEEAISAAAYAELIQSPVHPSTHGDRQGWEVVPALSLDRVKSNGRTQRILLDQLAELSGFAFEWSAISGEQMAMACREARQDEPNYDKLSHLLRLHITTL